MSKKVLRTMLFTLVIAAALSLAYLTIEKISAKKTKAHKVSILSVANFLNSDSTTVKISTDSNVVLIFFNPECEHCQYEARGIKENVNDFKNTELIFISSESIAAIQRFASQYNLENYPFVHFTKINREEIFDTFGTLSVPHIFIYDKDHKLIKEFKGETKVEAILKYLQ